MCVSVGITDHSKGVATKPHRRRGPSSIATVSDVIRRKWRDVTKDGVRLEGSLTRRACEASSLAYVTILLIFASLPQ